MTADRHLDWDGCYNVRDLGGLRTIYGRTTRWGAVVRADAPDRLTPAGWSALKAYGIRTIIDLRNDEERHADTTPHAAKLTTVHVPLDDPADLEFGSTGATAACGPRRSTTGPSLTASRSGAPPSPTPSPVASWSTAVEAATAPDSSPCWCWRWLASRPTTSPPTTN